MKNTYFVGAFAVLFVALSTTTPAFAAHHNNNKQKQGQIVTLSAPQQWTVAGTLTLGSNSGNTGKNKKQKTPQTATSTPPASGSGQTTAPVTAPVSNGSEVRVTAYTTGYGWPDNTPPGGAISNPVIHSTAGGTGTYADPITLAVGHSIISGQDILDYAAGTKFYIPNLRKYFIVEDTCGDGNQPQNGPCHTGYQGHVWVDMWVGGQGLSSQGTLACEDTITDLHTIIENPASNYAVVPGPVYSGTCATQFGETVVTQ